MKTQQRKLIAIVAILLGCIAWIGYYGATRFGSTAPESKPPSSPAWNVAHAAQAKLSEDERFRTLAIVPSPDESKLVVTGAIRSRSDIPALETALNNQKLSLPFEIHAEPMD